MTLFPTLCLVLSTVSSAQLDTQSRIQFHMDTAVAADSVQPLLTEDLLNRLMVFGKNIESGRADSSWIIWNRLIGVKYTADAPDTTGRLVPVSIVLGDSTVHFQKRIETHIARAAAKDTTVAKGLKTAGLTATQAEMALLAIWTSKVTLTSVFLAKDYAHTPTPAEAQTVYWRNIDFVQTHSDKIKKLWTYYGFDVGFQNGQAILSQSFRGPAF